jgi:hypothetical protein
MSQKIPRLTHWGVAKAQVGLSYLFLLGFFSVLILEGLGYLKNNVSNNLREVLMLVMSFWFMRARVSGDEPEQIESPTIPSVPTQPPSSAKTI